MLIHKVLFNFKPQVTTKQINHMYKLISDLPSNIPNINTVDLEHIYLSMNGQRFQGGFKVIFSGKSGLESYIPHSAHKIVSDKILDICKDIKVKDYYSNYRHS